MAHAGPPYVIDANGTTTGTFTASASSVAAVQLTNTRSGAILTCLSSAAQADGTLGSHASGAGLAAITSLTYATCTGPGGLVFTVNASPTVANPALLNASGSTASGVTAITVSNVTAAISGNVGSPTGPTCNFSVSGSPTVATTPATVSGTYVNGSASALPQLKIASSPGQLYINNITGTASAAGSCIAGALRNGDAVVYSGTYDVDTTTPAAGDPLNLNG
ncbi:hypothetical protein CCO04_18040 [Pimelobacter sp. 30-1]|nr:hypothetical protein [Pimelobacter sp. 30-1]